MTLHGYTNAVFRSQDVPWLQWTFGVSSYVSLLPGFLIFHLTGSNCSSLHESRQDSKNLPPPKGSTTPIRLPSHSETTLGARAPVPISGFLKNPWSKEATRNWATKKWLWPWKSFSWQEVWLNWYSTEMKGCSQPGRFISSYAGKPMSESPGGGNQTQMTKSASLKSTSKCYSSGHPILGSTGLDCPLSWLEFGIYQTLKFGASYINSFRPMMPVSNQTTKNVFPIRAKNIAA